MFGPRGERVGEWQASLNGYGVFDQFRGAFDEMQRGRWMKMSLSLDSKSLRDTNLWTFTALEKLQKQGDMVANILHFSLFFYFFQNLY